MMHNTLVWRSFLRDLHQQVAEADLQIAAVNAGHTRVPEGTPSRKTEKYMTVLRALSEHLARGGTVDARPTEHH